MAKKLRLRMVTDETNMFYFLLRKRWWGWETILRSHRQEDVEKGFDNYVKYGTTDAVLKEYNSELEATHAEQ